MLTGLKSSVLFTWYAPGPGVLAREPIERSSLPGEMRLRREEW